MKKCCEKELRTYRKALDLARCEVIHATGDYTVVNRIQWAIERADRVAKNFRNGMRGRKAWMNHFPALYKALWPAGRV